MKKQMMAAWLGLGAAGALVMSVGAASTPAHAQFGGVVFDPTNYTQNLLTAARALQQINNQVQSLQNEAQMLVNQAKDLARIDFPQLRALQQRSQGAEGSLQAQQATNQLLALTAKQQLQIQNLLAAQFRADTIGQARAGQIEREAGEATRRFLGDGRAYTPRR